MFVGEHAGGSFYDLHLAPAQITTANRPHWRTTYRTCSPCLSGIALSWHGDAANASFRGRYIISVSRMCYEGLRRELGIADEERAQHAWLSFNSLGVEMCAQM